MLEVEHQSFSAMLTNNPGGSTLFNYHSGYQITLITVGEGFRYIGDNISPYKAPDMVVIGPDIPHMWRTSDPRGTNDSIVINFSERFLCGSLHQTPDFAGIDRMLRNANRGWLVGEETRKAVESDFWNLQNQQGFEQLSSLLRILNRLASRRDLQPIASVAFGARVEMDQDSRLSQVYQYIQRHMNEPISRDKLAKIACMSPSSFSRYFKSRDGISLPAYLNDFRIGHACRLLAISSLSISEIAIQSGFDSVTSFNRVFQISKKITPTDYRRTMNRAYQPQPQTSDTAENSKVT